MIGDIKVGAVVMQSPVGDIRGNLTRVSSFVDEAVDKHVDILCFPEMNLTGYSHLRQIRTIADTLQGPLLEALLDLARQSGVIILAGLAEREGEQVYATHVAVSPQGLLGFYRKVHLGPPEEKTFTPGKEITLFQASGAKFGIQTCYDAHFPELSSIMALKGADILFFPHASPNGTPREKLKSWLRHLTARAYDNGVFVVACNLLGDNGLGTRFPGAAVILSPEGRVMVEAAQDKEMMITTVLKHKDLEHVRGHRMRYFLPRRRPELYGDLIQPETKQFRR